MTLVILLIPSSRSVPVMWMLSSLNFARICTPISRILWCTAPINAEVPELPGRAASPKEDLMVADQYSSGHLTILESFFIVHDERSHRRFHHRPQTTRCQIVLCSVETVRSTTWSRSFFWHSLDRILTNSQGSAPLVHVQVVQTEVVTNLTKH